MKPRSGLSSRSSKEQWVGELFIMESEEVMAQLMSLEDAIQDKLGELQALERKLNADTINTIRNTRQTVKEAEASRDRSGDIG